MSVTKTHVVLAAIGLALIFYARAQDIDAVISELLVTSPAVSVTQEQPVTQEQSVTQEQPGAVQEAEGNVGAGEAAMEGGEEGAAGVATPAESAPAVETAPVQEAVVEPTDQAQAEEPAAEAPAAEDAAQALAEDIDLEALLGSPEQVAAQPAADQPAEEAAAQPEAEEAQPTVAPGEEAVAQQEGEPAAPTAEGVPAELPADAGPAQAALVAQQEEIRRQAREVEGRLAAERGLVALREGRYDEAIRELAEAQVKLPVREANMALIAEVAAGLAEAQTRRAEQAYERRDLKIAREAIEAAKAAGGDPKKIKSLDKKISRAEEKEAAARAKPVPVKKRPEYVEKQKTIEQLLREGKEFFNARDYNSAEARFESVLAKDEYNVDAMKYLRRIDEIRYSIRSKEREATVAKLIEEVRDSWTPPVKAEAVLPEAVVARGAVETQTAAQKLQAKMESIIIPVIDFRQANINDVINYLREESIKQDKDGVGVNIILNPNVLEATAAPPPAPAPALDQGEGMDNFGGDFGTDFGAPPQDFTAPAPSVGVPTITLTLRRISLLDAIKYITEVARLKFRIEENVVMITPENMPTGRVITRMYPVQPSILDVIVEKDESAQQQTGFVEMGAKSTQFKKADVKEFFERAGVPFPQGTSITYNPTISQLIVANTPENLEVFERILSRLNVIPNQVEIEARFVEIAQDDLEELGLQWILTDNWEIASRKGPFGAAGSERIQMNADPLGVTKGLRFMARNSATGTIEPFPSTLVGTGVTPLGGIATFASVLTNPELSIVINALSQHGGTDLLSAPRVTTRSGVNAQIQVVREIIYPSEFETTQPQFNESGSVTTPPVVTPGNFQTRETGVILNVTPTVGPDGYTIDLVMVPEVSELVDWIQYGSSISIPRPDPVTGLFVGDQTFTFNIPQPIFSSRNVTTSIVIWDGQTVVMGGLIREDLVRVKDKIPFLGDIPVLGRLFRNEAEYSRKKNLLIFVTARLVDPAGKPINRGEIQPEAEDVAAKP
ncbi:MAG: hypothetical protein NZ740_04550 [Kiritimatiellae bacterium]|nr:hypothetical protein [Kiritimatiellia bacterium]MDW8458361.1 hypothetical protein [Verrucomicrobiota bacterium]